MEEETAKYKPNLEYIPDILIGKLLQANITVQSAGLSQDTNNDLALFIELSINNGIFEDMLSDLLFSIGKNVSEFLTLYPQIESLVVYATSTTQGRWGTSKKLKIKSRNVLEWHTETVSDEFFLSCFVPENNWILQQETRASKWESLIGLRLEELTKTLHLDRAPHLLIGKLWSDEFTLDTANIHRDKDGELTLYAEFPVDEKTEAIMHENILKVARCSVEFLLVFPELKRLSIWTRPEYDDKIAISSFWWLRENVIEWNQNKLTDFQLLELRKEYIS